MSPLPGAELRRIAVVHLHWDEATCLGELEELNSFGAERAGGQRGNDRPSSADVEDEGGPDDRRTWALPSAAGGGVSMIRTRLPAWWCGPPERCFREVGWCQLLRAGGCTAGDCVAGGRLTGR